MTWNDSSADGVPTPIARPQEHVLGEHRRVIPHGFSSTVDVEHDAVWGSAAQSWVYPVRGVPAALPLAGQDYAQVLRPLSRRVGRWFLAGGIILAFFLVGQGLTILLLLPLMGSFDSTDPFSAMTDLMGGWQIFLATNLSWAIMILGAFLGYAAYGEKAIGFIASVAGRWRWKVTARAALVIAPVFLVFIGVSLAIDPTVPWGWDPDWLLVAIVLLTTPLQCAGEEFAFRGVLTQAIGGWIPHRWVSGFVSAGVTALIFASVHGYDMWGTTQVFAIGFTCSMLAWRTGGLEAASVMHTCNNLFLMLPLALMGYSPFATPTATTSAPDLWMQVLTLGMALLAVGGCYALVHWTMRDVPRRTEGAPGAERLLLPKAPAQPYVAPGQQHPGYPQPYAPAGYPQPAYAQPGYQQPTYVQPGYQPQGYPQQAYVQQGHQPQGYPQPGYQPQQQPVQPWPQQPQPWPQQDAQQPAAQPVQQQPAAQPPVQQPPVQQQPVQPDDGASRFQPPPA